MKAAGTVPGKNRATRRERGAGMDFMDKGAGINNGTGDFKSAVFTASI